LAGDTAITLAQVSGLLGVRRGETPVDWCAAVLDDATGRAAGILPHVLAQSGVSGVGLITQLGTQLLGLGLARSQFERGLRGGPLQRAVFDAILRARPARLDYKGSAERWGRLAERWPLPRIDSAITATLEADRRLKSTTLATEQGVLLDLVMQLGFRSREAA
jgi:DNA polymerase III delta subunit